MGRENVLYPPVFYKFQFSLEKAGWRFEMQKIGVSPKGVIIGFILALVSFNMGRPAHAVVAAPAGPGYQCPNDIDNRPLGWSSGGSKGVEDRDQNGNGIFDADPNVVCMRLGVTDGYVKMPDGSNHYIFGFVDLTGVPENEIVNYKFKSRLPAPTIEVQEGQTLYLTETNLALYLRPDLDDSHTLHFHGFPHAMAIFDGVPELSIAVPAGRDFTYFYKLNDPGSYPYHCHFEPVEHIQMGMVGIIVVHPKQNGVNGAGDVLTGKYAYNDGGLAPDTGYDIAYPLLINELDAAPHRNLETIQEGATLWHEYQPNYFTINGRAYPDTILADDDPSLMNQNGYIAQTSSLITAGPNQKILLRIVSLGYQTHSLTVPGIPMHVVGEDAKLLRGPDGKDLSYWKTVYSIAGGKTADIILDTAGLNPGETYFLFARELHNQSNLSLTDRLMTRNNPAIKVGAENRGGMMTEIRIIN